MLFSLNGPARSGNLRGIALAEMRIQAPSAEGTRPVSAAERNRRKSAEWAQTARLSGPWRLKKLAELRRFSTMMGRMR